MVVCLWEEFILWGITVILLDKHIANTLGSHLFIDS